MEHCLRIYKSNILLGGEFLSLQKFLFSFSNAVSFLVPDRQILYQLH